MSTYTTSDLPLTAFLVIKGLKLVTAEKSAGGKFEFVLEDPEGKARELAIEYVNSDFSKFDNQIRNIKKVLYTNK